MDELTSAVSDKFAVRAKWVAILLGSYALVAGTLSLCGWVFDINRLTDWEGNGISIQPNTTLCVIFTGLAIIFLALGKKNIAGYFGAVPFAIGGLTAFQYVSSLDLGIDQLLMFDREWGRRGTLVPGRMGPPSTFSWTVIGVALITAGLLPQWRRAVTYLTLPAAFIALLTFVGNLYGADFLYTLPRLTVIASQTSTFIFASSIGLMLTMIDREPVRTLLADSAGGLMARSTMPILVILPVLLGLFLVWGQESGHYDTAMGTAVLVLAVIIVMCIVLWHGAVTSSGYEAEAERKDRRLAAIVGSSRDAIISKGLDTIITSWNAGAEELFGYTADEVIGQSVRILIPEDRQDEEAEILGRITKGESVNHYKTIRRRKDGTLVDISLTVSPIRSENGTIIGASKIARDITEQKRAEQRIADDLRATTRLRDIGAMSARADCDVDLCLEAVLDAAIDFSRAAKGNIQLFRQDEEVLEIVMYHGFGEPFLEFFEAVGINQAAACTAALQGLRRIVVEDITKSRIFIGQPSLQILLNEGIHAVQSTPLISSTGRAIGMISTHFSEPHKPSDRELNLLDLLARQVADMIERRSAQELLEKEVAERTRELNDANAALVAETESRIGAHQQRIELLGRLVEGQEAERHRIGRDIHDQLGQRLTGLRLQLESLKSAMVSDPTGETAVRHMERLDEIAQMLDREVSHLAWELRPTVLEQFGLVETLRLFVHEWSTLYGVPSEFQEVNVDHEVLHKDIETNLYRITQEALNNVAKHAGANNVSVQLARRNGMISLIIEDDGRGFKPNGESTRKGGPGGLGLRGIKERAELIGADVEIQSEPGTGTTVFVRIAESALNPPRSDAAGQ